MKDFLLKYKMQFGIIFVLILTYFLYFHNLWNFRLLDVDETRYVDMARCMHNTKDYMTLYLNGQYFFEKPPLYFWILNLSFFLFNTVNEFTARIPGCLMGILGALALFFTTKRFTNNTKLALISSLILLSATEYVILSKIAILDIYLAVLATISVLFGFMTFVVENQNKKYFWWLFYLFSALALLAKGIPGIVLPFGIMFIAGIYTKKLKEYFNPTYMLPGIIIFLLVSLPWHILMLNKYNPLFYDEYIIKHHIARFLGSEVINRKEPFWFYIPVILCGILPFLASFIALLAEKCMKIKSFCWRSFDKMTKTEQFTALNIIAATVTFLFFSTSGTKLVTYIVPIFPYLAVCLGNYWYEYIEDNQHKKNIEISSLIFNWLFIIAGIGFFITIFFLKEPLKSDLTTIITPVLITTVIFPILGLVAIKKHKRILLFISYVIMMAFLCGFGFNKFMELDYRFGQADLMEYAQYAKENNLNLYTFQTGSRYSLLYYSKNNVNFDIEKENFATIINDKSNLIIIRKKHLDEIADENFNIIKKGRKYYLLSKEENEQ